MDSHALHNRRWGYPSLVLRHSTVDSARRDSIWNKPSFILSVLMDEMRKAPEERLEWIFWHDADTILLSPHIPLHTFLPPAHYTPPPQLLISANPHGINNGAFFVRVSAWAVDLFTAVLAFPFYQPGASLRFRDQSALELVLGWDGSGGNASNDVANSMMDNGVDFRSGWIQVPMRWFNAWVPDNDGIDLDAPANLTEPHTSHSFQARPGDLLVHFAGIPQREKRMEAWLWRAQRIAQGAGEWTRATRIEDEVKEWWAEKMR